ncbi:T9SS type A sorting domain-containing protein [uncultured Winogradskyella sp.]|uniref:T9SS type A sorting domain-containing protein n=1 Tax=uncultured Winogradskyella sp. TaxID=395353 RepID=UPI00262B5563|nr:T9SS type A sorting domain-containing protein [uncultured Winogradskyella sp.]
MNKVLPTLLIFLFSFFSFSQNDFIGTWYLDYIVKDGITFPNYFNDNQVFEITFTNTENGVFEDYLNFSMGHGCNASNGIYAINSNEITVDISATTLADCLTRPHAQYEAFFLDEFLYHQVSSVYTYSISGDANDQILTMVNPVDGNLLVYKKEQPTTLLISTWWLHQIDIPGNPIIDIPTTDFPNITFTNTVSSLPFIPEADGAGECESFFANYNVTFNGANNISTSEFVQTLAGCATESYEGIYFEILGNNTSNFFEFEIINNGSTLILTDLLGAKLIFGDTTLSLDKYNANNFKISITQNPVNNQLFLEIDDSIISEQINYTIYSIDGKRIKYSILNKNTITVSEMEPGIYFISFTNNNKVLNTLKFIKK